jgi:uncharacterized protein YdeI (YjbR/CyaY-like superfamily)
VGREDLVRVSVTSRAQWRAWLVEHADTSPGVWLVLDRPVRPPRRSAPAPDPSPAPAAGAPTYDDLLEEALCFGWIDSTGRRLDDRTLTQLWTPRRPRSLWSASNKERVAALEAAGLMAEPGRRAIARARSNGSWDVLVPVEGLEVPDDLAAALAASPPARAAFDALTPGARKQLLRLVATARRPDTRAARIATVVATVSADRPAPG